MALPRGIRNNNPGNIELGAPWQGLASGQTDGRFAQFVSPEYGIRAMAKVLRNYQRKHGLTTPRQMIGRWAPSSENDVGAYVSSVARHSGLDPDAEIDLSRDGAKLISAMIRHENGRQPYSRDVIMKGIGMAGLGDFRVAGDFSREEIEAEMRRRGLSSPQFSRDELEAEMQRRGLLDDGVGQMNEAVGSAINEMNDPQAAIRAEEERARQLRLSYAEPEAGEVEQGPVMPAETPDRGLLKPTDVIAGSIPIQALTLLRRTMPEYYQNLIDTYVKGATFGASDEAVAAANVPLGTPYEEGLAGERETLRQFKEENPVAAGVAETAGAITATLPFGGGLVGAARQLGTGAVVGAGAMEGAALAATYDFLSGEGGFEERLSDATSAAYGGAIAGGILARAGVSLDRFIKARELAKAAPSLSEASEASVRMIKEAENVNILYDPRAVRALTSHLERKLLSDDATRIMTRRVHPNASGAYAEIQRALRGVLEEGGKPLTFKRIIALRQIANDALVSAKPGSPDRAVAVTIRDILDRFAETETFMLGAAPGRAAGRAAVDLRREGAKAYAQFKKAELIQNTIEDVLSHADSLDSGGNVAGSLRREFSKLHKKAKRRKLPGWTDEEIAALGEVANQGTINNLVRTLGKTAPSGSALMMSLQTIQGVMTGGWGAIVIPAAEAAKIATKNTTTKRANRVLQLILTGGKVPPTMLRNLTRAERRSIARGVTSVWAGRSTDTASEVLTGQGPQ